MNLITHSLRIVKRSGLLAISILLLCGVLLSVSSPTASAATNPLDALRKKVPTIPTDPTTPPTSEDDGYLPTTPTTPDTPVTPSDPVTPTTPGTMTDTTTTSTNTTTPTSAATTTSKATSSKTTTPSAAATTDTSTLTTGDGKDARYYPVSKLSQDKTNRLLSIALLTLEIGGASLAIGLLVLGIRRLASRSQLNQPEAVRA